MVIENINVVWCKVNKIRHNTIILSYINKYYLFTIIIYF
nr:MAG TPA: hypothetical protein [Caudoviricetes sp.]DAL38437.1 MAG TPA_asm: hypothetical protein [Caudoviricetes sp.]